MSKFQVAGKSEGGKRPESNEDYFVADSAMGLYLICDGVGWAAGGEVASRLAAETVTQTITQQRRSLDTIHSITSAMVVSAISKAFEKIGNRSRTDDRLQGMGTTLTMLLIDNVRTIVGHLGDSRLYLVRNDELHQLTCDHPMTETLQQDTAIVTEPDVFELLLRPGDVLLLGTDGLNVVFEDEMWVTTVVREQNVHEIANTLLARQDDLGDHQDATIVVIRVCSNNPPAIGVRHHLPTGYRAFQMIEACANV